MLNEYESDGLMKDKVLGAFLRIFIIRSPVRNNISNTQDLGVIFVHSCMVVGNPKTRPLVVRF